MIDGLRISLPSNCDLDVQEILVEGGVVWPDIWYYFKPTKIAENKLGMNFELWAIASMPTKGEVRPEIILDDEIVMTAWLKWDGCCEFKCDSGEGRCGIHFCGTDNFNQFHEAVQRIYKIAHRYINTKNGIDDK